MLKGVRRAALPACPETGCCYYLGSLLIGALIGASRHARRYAPGHRIALGKRRRGVRGVLELLRYAATAC